MHSPSGVVDDEPTLIEFQIIFGRFGRVLQILSESFLNKKF